jgi:hypothetical protein
MARFRDIRLDLQGDGVDGVETPGGYLLAPGKTPEDILARTAALLESEGINADWPGFGDGVQHPKHRST